MGSVQLVAVGWIADLVRLLIKIIIVIIIIIISTIITWRIVMVKAENHMGRTRRTLGR